MKEALYCSLFLSLLFTATQSAHAATNSKLTLETGLEYYTGKYGTDHETNIMYIPVTCKIQAQGWSLKMSIPYIQISGANDVVGGLGQTAGPAAHTYSVRSGMGDFHVAASHNVISGGSRDALIQLTGKAKFATADSNKGLGTGKNDYALETTLFKPFGSLAAFATLGYKDYGSPAAYKLNNVFYGSLGGNYKFNRDTNGGAMLYASQKVLANKSHRAEALLFVGHTLGNRWKMRGYLLRGFTNSVPDWGGGVLVNYLFEKQQLPAELAMPGSGKT